MKRMLLFVALTAGLCLSALADLTKDSPVKFPAKGALPAKYPPDEPSKENEPTEEGYYIFSTPERSLAQIDKIQAEMPLGRFQPPAPDWKHLARTRRILSEGGELRLLALGDSIVNDTMRSGWVAKLRQAYPNSRIHGTVYVRGGGGCQHFKEAGRLAKVVIPCKPDLVFIGGISQKDIESIREVIRALRIALPEVEILLATGAFGTADPRVPEELAKAAWSGAGSYGVALRQLASDENCAYLDMTTPWAQYICSSNLHPHLFYRDAVHANEFGEQILSKIMLAFLASPSASVSSGPGPIRGSTSALGGASALHRAESQVEFPKPADLPLQALLPDPLVMFDGRKVTSPEMWRNERRPELIRLFQHYMFGQLPPTPTTVTSQVERVDEAAFGDTATLSEVTLIVGLPEVAPIHLLLVVPNRRLRPAPVVLAINYFGNHTLVHDKNVRLADNWMPERGQGVVANHATEASRGTWAEIWRIQDIIDRGYALATFYNGDVDPDTPDQRGVQKFFHHADPADDCGSIGAWAWGLQRAVDYLVTAPGIDSRRIVVTGHSRMGKAALLAAAFDERIALAIPHQAGCGGSAPSRARIAIGKSYDTLDTPQTRPPETVFNINDQFPHWFNARFKEFNNQPERLPFDQHCLVALCAPRPVLFTNGRSDTWINPAGQFEVLRAAAPVYRLLGAGDFTADELPPDGRLIDGVLGYSLRPGGHSLLREDWKAFLDFADKHLGRP